LLSADSSDLPFDKAKRLNGIHALIVDDEADARELIMFILAEHGASVTTAASVSEAVGKFQAIKPDLIISDIEMPDEDGFSLIEKLRDFNEREQKKIPAIALTAHARPSERLKVLSAGYQMHLAKPVEPAELIAVVANFANWNKQK
jgi:CheY-like chemotaxis protein